MTEVATYRNVKPNMTLDAVLRRAIRRAPCSMRALARAAGVSHVMLQGIVAGRERATVRVAQKVVRALESWAARCGGEAAAIQAVINQFPIQGGRMGVRRRRP